MISIALFQVQAVFCVISGSRDISKTKWGIRFQECEILYYYSAGEKRPCTKMLFLVPKNVLFVIFFFSCVNIVFCELMLLELGDLLGLSLLRNFFSAANISARLLNISSSSNLIPHFVLHISRLPDIAQKTACTQNEAMDVTFQMKYVSAF